MNANKLKESPRITLWDDSGEVGDGGGGDDDDGDSNDF